MTLSLLHLRGFRLETLRECTVSQDAILLSNILHGAVFDLLHNRRRECLIHDFLDAVRHLADLLRDVIDLDIHGLHFTLDVLCALGLNILHVVLHVVLYIFQFLILLLLFILVSPLNLQKL